MPSTPQKKSEKTKLILEVSAVVISAIAMLLSWQSNQTAKRANEIAQQANKPQIVLINAIDEYGAWDIRNDLETIVCRSRIRFANLGGASTSITSVISTIHFENKTESFSFSDISNHASIDDMYFSGKLWKDNPPSPLEVLDNSVSPNHITKFPMLIDFHSATDIWIDTIVDSDPNKHELAGITYKDNPADPLLSDGSTSTPLITVVITLKFTDTNSIITSPLFCAFVHTK